VRDNETGSAAELLAILAGELGMEEAAILDFGLGQLGDFLEKTVVQVTQVSSADVAPAPAGE
jgi:hypothetical protein